MALTTDSAAHANKMSLPQPYNTCANNTYTYNIHFVKLLSPSTHACFFHLNMNFVIQKSCISMYIPNSGMPEVALAGPVTER